MAHAARAMRSVVVDFARRRAAERRGGDVEHVPLTEGLVESNSEQEILQVHAALETSEEVDPRLVRVVEMRYFAGMTEEEIGQVLDIIDRTVRRDWEKARLLLHRR